MATDPRTGLVYAANPDGKIVELTPAGKVKREIKLDTKLAALRIAHLDADEDVEFITYPLHDKPLDAWDSRGRQLWSYKAVRLWIEDALPVDLHRDGTDEVIVADHGLNGLHLLDHIGKPLWKKQGMDSVWYVSAGDVNGDGG